MMIYFAFGKISRKKYLKAVFYLYLLSFIVIGTILSLLNIYGISLFQVEKNMIKSLMLGIIVLILLGKFGWSLFQNYITPEVFLVPIKIMIASDVVNIKGLVDTGNKLVDPLTKVPVIVLEINHIYSLLPQKLVDEIRCNQTDLLNIINSFNDFDWGHKIRVLPFSDLGQEHGMLLGLKPDNIIITYKNKLIQTDQVILGLTDHKLDQEEKYEALINPQILNLN
jgi:stage II sporulation protein GA (sporulation sigma-E factor processing peptidase)